MNRERVLCLIVAESQLERFYIEDGEYQDDLTVVRVPADDLRLSLRIVFQRVEICMSRTARDPLLVNIVIFSV